MHRAPSRNASPSVAVDENNETQSLLNEHGEAPEQSEDADDNDSEEDEEDKEEEKWYEESASVEKDESTEYYQRKYCSESSTNSDSTDLSKDVKIGHSTGRKRNQDDRIRTVLISQ